MRPTQIRDFKMNTTYENPNVTYKPSGQIGCGILKLFAMYALFALIGSIAVQVPVGLVGALANIFLMLVVNGTFPGNIIIAFFGICFVGGGYLLSGGLLGIIIRQCTKLLHCRNMKFENAAIAVGMLFIILIKIFIASKTWEYFASRSSMEIDWLTWVHWVIALFLVWIGALWVFTADMLPYCEKCEKYMKKQVFNFDINSEENILHVLCSGMSTSEERKALLNQCQKISGKKMPDNYLALNLHACDICKDGFVSVTRHETKIGTDKKEQKVQTVIYANQVNEEGTAMLSSGTVR